MRPLRPTAAAAVVALLLVLSVGGCTNADGVIRETPTPATSATRSLSSASPTPTTGEERILAQYRAFFNIQASASGSPEAQRRAMLEPYATDPALSRVLRGMHTSDKLGQVGYGQAVVRPSVTKIDGRVAWVGDCQDTSASGRKERATGKVVTRGTKQAKVAATLKRGPDGVWRVATVDYQGDRC
jgi:hypothetical protein